SGIYTLSLPDALPIFGAMTLEQRPLDVTTITRRRELLVERREQLRGYVGALHTVREPWGCSAYDALQGLARLTAHRPAPQTKVRSEEHTSELQSREKL